jgi:peptide chain release factor subunit 1
MTGSIRGGPPEPTAQRKDCVMDNTPLPHVLVLTPMKNAARYLDSFFACLARLDYPRERLSLGVLEGDSSDETYPRLEEKLAANGMRFQRVSLFRRDYGFVMPAHLPRWSQAFQYARRVTLAKARNYLLSRALNEEDFVLWLDVDVIDYPPDVLKRLLAHGKSMIQPDCVTTPGGPSFDRNAWVEKGARYIHDFRGLPSPQRLDSVGGTMLLVDADLHREGLVFPPFAFGERHPAIRDHNPCLPPGRAGEIETEGLGIMALAMGHQPWAAQDIEILHAPD